MAVTSTNQNFSTSSNRILAFFKDRSSAYRAVSALKDAGFTSEEIGLIDRSSDDVEGGSSNTEHESSNTEQNEGVWEKIKHFFSGESSDNVDYRESSTGLDWDQKRGDYYYRGIGQGGAVVSVAGSRLDDARKILQREGGDLSDSGYETQDVDEAENNANANADEEDYRIQLRGEVLRTFRERVQSGEVRLRKEVITENQSVQVPVTREELVVERVGATGQESPDAGQIGSDQEIRVPLSEERARVEKKPVVTEEVRVGKRKVQDTELVSEDVRHEELRLDKDGDVEIDTRTGTKKGKKPAA